MTNSAKRRLERVRNVFNADDLIRICSQQDFSDYAHRVDLPPGRSWQGKVSERFFYYRDRGSPILAIGHLDHVQDDPTCTIVPTGSGPLALSGALDDRLGVYVILEMLPKLGIEVDWLLTTDEEMGDSTAQNFYVDHKQYHWMFEFDRGGTDVVSYQYDSEHLNDLVRASGAHMGHGSYSDIAELEHLGCIGLNWGVGYEDYHSARSHAWLEDTFKMVAKFMRFYNANAATHLPWSKAVDQFGNGRCPDCQSELDRHGACWGCGYGAFLIEKEA